MVSNYKRIGAPSGYIGNLEGWMRFWKEFDQIFFGGNFIFEEVATQQNLQLILMDDKHSSLSHFIDSGGVYRVNALVKLIDSWPIESNFFYDNNYFSLKNSSSEVKDIYFPDFDTMSITSLLIVNEEMNVDDFFEYDEGLFEAEYSVPVEYLDILPDCLAFAEDVLANELYWVSSQLKSSDGEWEISCFQPDGSILTRFNCFARAVFFILNRLFLYMDTSTEAVTPLMQKFNDLMFDYRITRSY